MEIKSPKAILFDWNNTLTKASERIYRARRLAFSSDAYSDLSSCAISGAEPLLDFLQSKSVYIALVSNEHGDSLREEVQSMHWEKYFSRVVGAGDAAESKPSAAPVKLALEDSGISPGEEVWFVGDSAIDMECAHNSHLISVLYGPESPEAFIHSMSYRPHLHITDYAGMIDLLKRL